MLVPDAELDDDDDDDNDKQQQQQPDTAEPTILQIKRGEHSCELRSDSLRKFKRHGVFRKSHMKVFFESAATVRKQASCEETLASSSTSEGRRLEKQSRK